MHYHSQACISILILYVAKVSGSRTNDRDFPRPDFGSNIGPSQSKNKQKLPKMVYTFPNFLVLHFGENFIKI